ncbi:MAG: arginine N-succinyltransferase, partial [Alphaproteobacteria bacterium]
QAAIGKVHDDGRAARALLLEEGFREEGYVDIFDAGPTLVAEIDQLRAVRDLHHGLFAGGTVTHEVRDHMLVKGSGADFCCVPAAVEAASGHIRTDRSSADLLGLAEHDPIGYLAL